MISTATEYECVLAQLEHLESWLQRLKAEAPLPENGLVRCGIRKLISRLQEELAFYEGTLESQQNEPPQSEERPSQEHVTPVLAEVAS